MNDLVTQIIGWCAYLSAAATILTFITGILFFTIGEPFGKINDTSSIYQVLFMVPLAIALILILPTHNYLFSILTAIIGVTGMLLTGFGQSLLVFGRIDFETSLKFFPAGGAIGFWLVAISLLGYVDGLFPALLTWIGILAGIGYLFTVVGFLVGGQQNWLFYLGALILGIGYPVWGIWLGSLINSGSI